MRSLYHRVAVGLLLSVATVVTVQPAQAQITVESLIGSSVPAKGPYYIDIKQAIDKFQVREFEETKKLLNQARGKSLKLPPAEVMMAQLYLMGNMTPQARVELEASAKVNPLDPEAYIVLGEMATTELRVAEALLLFNRGSELAKAYRENSKRKTSLQIRALSGLESLYEAQEQWDLARNAASDWIKLDVENGAAHLRMGRVLFQLAKYEEAYREFQEAAKIDNKLPPAEVTMASLFRSKGDKVQNREWLDKALKTGASDATTQIAVANMKFQSGELDEAIEHVNLAFKADPSSLDAKILHGMIARMKRDYDTARKFLEAAHNQAPSNSMIINQLALTLLETPGETERRRALEFAEMNYRANGNSPEAAATVAWIYYRLGRVAEGKALMDGATRAGAGSPDVVYYVARMKASDARAAEAIDDLNKVLDRKIEMPFFYRVDAEGLYKELSKKEKAGSIGRETPDRAPAATTTKTAASETKSEGETDKTSAKAPAAAVKKKDPAAPPATNAAKTTTPPATTPKKAPPRAETAADKN